MGVDATVTREPTKTLGLYLHVPFCRSKCLYCDFCSVPVRNEDRFSDYVERLCRDLWERAESCADRTVDSVYVGGGTPTVLPPQLLERIFACVRKNYRLAGDAEITVECNPVTESRALFECLVACGVNRLSIGVQSVHDNELRRLGRLHSFSDVKATVRDARAAGIENLSLDVMFGIPEQTIESYLATLQALCELSPMHISAYGLGVEEGTPFGKMGDRLILPDEETTRKMYFDGVALLAKNGYLQYEISNFARAGYRSRHNLKYWNCDAFLGFGPAAYSDFGGSRFGNSRDLDAYLRGEPIVEETETPTLSQRKNEFVMLAMRLSEGISQKKYRDRFGADAEAEFGAALSRYIELGLIRKTEDGYAFTPDGMYVSNAVLSEILDFEA